MDKVKFKVHRKKTVDKKPIVYSPDYDIGFLGIENLHPFDSKKWGKVYRYLKEAKIINDQSIHIPVEASVNQLLTVHSKDYLHKLKWSINVAKITELAMLAVVPNFILQQKLLRPLRFQTNGTLMAAKLAMEYGWSLNIGGGFHHCSSERGGGFCAYADISLGIRYLLDNHSDTIFKIMIVDLDAHQGNGHERDFINVPSVYIMDVYNKDIYPRDGYAKQAINKKVELKSMTTDALYLDIVQSNLLDAVKECSPNFILYNAGTDIMAGDSLGQLNISAEGIMARDEMVFMMAKTKNIPIAMVTSGGYQKKTSRVIANSIINLFSKDLIS